MTQLWILIAISAYLLMALSQLFDKALLGIAFQEVKAYVLLVGLLGTFALFLLPFGVTLPSLSHLFVSLIGGALFIVALIPFLSGLQKEDASRILPLVGATVPTVIVIGEYFFLGERLTALQYSAFALLVIGAALLTWTPNKKKRVIKLATFQAILGGILFAISFLITKYIFDQLSFVNGFFWMRLGGVIVALALFAYPNVRKELKQLFSKNRKVLLGYFGNQALNGGGFVLQNYAISLASVSLVSALQGVQYLFVILIIGLASLVGFKFFSEQLSVLLFIEKLVAVLVLLAGMALLFL